MGNRQILHARFVFPVVRDPIENGFVSFEDGRIVEVGKSPPPGERYDLGNAAILPGFVNAHAHLEFSGLAKPLGAPAWVLWIGFARSSHGAKDTRLDPAVAIAMGLQECGREGVTSVGNISQPGDPTDAYENFSADGTRFLEIISPKRDILALSVDVYPKHFATNKIEHFPQTSDQISRIVNLHSKNHLLLQEEKAADWEFGLSPHAPYSISSELLENLAGISSIKKIPLAMHLAESREEMQLLREGTGPFRDFLHERNIFDPAAFPGGKRPLDYLKTLSKASRALIIHGNYLDDAEIAFLTDQAAKMSVVYCPRTHAFFGTIRIRWKKCLPPGCRSPWAPTAALLRPT